MFVGLSRSTGGYEYVKKCVCDQGSAEKDGVCVGKFINFLLIVHFRFNKSSYFLQNVLFCCKCTFEGKLTCAVEKYMSSFICYYSKCTVKQFLLQSNIYQ